MNEEQNKYQKKNVFRNIAWKALERGAASIITLLVNIVLARLLPPSVHGLLAMVTVFIIISEIFVTAGLSKSLIQKKEADNIDYSSVFWSNMVISICIYFGLFFSSPIIAAYLGYEVLEIVLKVLGIRVFITAFNAVQRAYLEKNMLFKNYFFSTLSSKIISGVVGIIMAILGMGVWALVAQSILLSLIEAVVLWNRVKWRPSLVFSFKRALGLYSFAWKVMLTSFIETLTDQLRKFIIGRYYSSDDLGFYDKGLLFPTAVTTNVDTAVSTVIFPVLANAQDDINKLRDIYRKWISVFGYCMLPALFWLAAVAPILVPLLLTDTWTPSVIYLQIACGTYATWVIERPLTEAIKSIGRSDISLYIQIIKTVISLIVLLVVCKQGVMIIAISALLCALMNIIITMLFAKKYVDYSFRFLLKDIGATIILSLIMAITIWAIKYIIPVRIICLIVQTIVGVLIYVGLSMATHNQNLSYISSLLQ